ncbi:hypothetical protein ABW20_dc0102358 [Dactylellina cionopaga]|nr:hypothetical protein ABW20_dc0102358 [Dactylellina cionopaga]
MVLATARFSKALFDMATTMADIRGGVKGFDKEIGNVILGKLPKNLNELSAAVRDDIIKKATDAALKAEEQRQKNARKLRRRKLAADRST